jgi:uncharacterized protein YrzB (UPF0473 family)
MDEYRKPGDAAEEDGFGENYISLIDEDGVEIEFKIVDSIDIDDGSYVALEVPPDDPVAYLNSDGSLLIMKVIEEDGEEILALLEDDEEYEKISDIFMGRLSDLYDFDQDEEE